MPVIVHMVRNHEEQAYRLHIKELMKLFYTYKPKLIKKDLEINQSLFARLDGLEPPTL